MDALRGRFEFDEACGDAIVAASWGRSRCDSGGLSGRGGLQTAFHVISIVQVVARESELVDEKSSVNLEDKPTLKTTRKKSRKMLDRKSVV